MVDMYYTVVNCISPVGGGVQDNQVTVVSLQRPCSASLVISNQLSVFKHCFDRIVVVFGTLVKLVATGKRIGLQVSRRCWSSLGISLKGRKIALLVTPHTRNDS